MFARLLLAAATAALAALALLPVSGQAAALKFHACDGKKYQLLHPGSGPDVKVLRIKMRCLVAEATAAEVKTEQRITGKLPSKVRVYGARWYVGSFKCTYQAQTAYQQAVCVHTGKEAATVRFRLMSS